jgi:hypothetical protein
MTTPLGTFGLPADGVGYAALLTAIALLAVLRLRQARLWLESAPPRLLLGALALLAALLSAGYVAHYLRGGPRIIDATSYYLEARALANGSFSFPILEPSASFRGRFLVSGEDAQSLTAIFPPGYPALLSLGFLVGAPMVIGPLLASALTIATYVLAQRLFGSERLALVAALLSVLCAALRYHTADTMSHGFAALLLAVALIGLTGKARRATWLMGLATGLLIATRPVTGAVAVALALPYIVRERRFAFVPALLPGLLLLVLHQHAATGSLFGSAQLAYYRLADGPPGCFRYGFGRGIGCLYEHGDFVRSVLPDGYGLGSVLVTSLRRLALHLGDVTNAIPLTLLAMYAAFVGWTHRGVRLLALGTLALFLAYAPFYFDGSYPGGGARLYAEALPLEHVLIAFALDARRWDWLAAPLSLLGFAVHVGHGHRALAEREGGRPMFESAVLQQRGVDHGLVFVSTDHGFNLGHAPGRLNAARDVVVARRAGPARDARLWQSLGRPPAYLYLYDPRGRDAAPRLIPYAPEPSERLEAEHEWPVLGLANGWAHPVHVATSCASLGRGLRLRSASVEVEVPGHGAPRQVTLGWVLLRSSTGVELTAEAGLSVVKSQVSGGDERCFVQPPLEVGPEVRRLRAAASTDHAILDYLEVR